MENLDIGGLKSMYHQKNIVSACLIVYKTLIKSMGNEEWCRCIATIGLKN